MWRQLIFLHIPKTAGWALHAALLPIFGEAQSLRINDGDDLARLRALSPREFSRYRYVSGHFTYSDVKQKCRDDALFVSILREPVRRLISEFNYIASWSDHPHHDHFKDLRFSSHVAANAEFIRGLQCDWLSGHRDAERAMAVIGRTTRWSAPSRDTRRSSPRWGSSSGTRSQRRGAMSRRAKGCSTLTAGSAVYCLISALKTAG